MNKSHENNKNFFEPRQLESNWMQIQIQSLLFKEFIKTKHHLN